MENKEKQMIEQTINILYDIDDYYKQLPREQLENAIRFGSYYDALKLVKLGYRKINENEVVLTKEYYNKLCHLAYFGYDDAYAQGVKETINKLMDYNEFLLRSNKDDGLLYVDFTVWLEEVANELKEN